MKQLILFIVLLAVLLYPVSAANIYGTVYNSDLEPQINVILEIDTNPKQQFISKDASYSFNVPEGDYTIKARYLQNDLLVSDDEEQITVTQDGDYVLDLILFPNLDEEEQLIDETEDIETNGIIEEDSNTWLYIIIILIIAILAYLSYKKLKKRKKHEEVKETVQKTEEKEVEEKKETKEEKEEHIDPDDLKHYIDFIKKHKRVTQKDIRKNFPLSEAKISLIIADLEDRKIIRKIKKGRENIIIYNE